MPEMTVQRADKGKYTQLLEMDNYQRCVLPSLFHLFLEVSEEHVSEQEEKGQRCKVSSFHLSCQFECNERQ